MPETIAEPEAGPDAPPPTASTAPSRRATWLWRLAALVVVALAGALLYVAATNGAETKQTDTGDLVVTKLTPGDGAKALRQTQVGADLLEGFDGRLTINGTPIPEAQMDGVVDPSSPEARSADPNQPVRLRPNNRNRVFFVPGQAKVIEKLPQGKNTITVTYFRDGAPSLQRGSLTWTINVD